VLPVGYQQQFAVDWMIEMHLVDKPGFSKVISVQRAAVVHGMYLRECPDGTVIDDTEKSLARIDAKAPAILRSISDWWPLLREHKAILAEYFGVQHVRGTRWRDWHDEFSPPGSTSCSGTL
jgi:hypothetical protein